MGFLRRLFGGRADDAGDPVDTGDAAPDDGGDTAVDADLAAQERARDRELLRADADRLDDDLLQRQLRYADRSWAPPAQGGQRRADDADRNTANDGMRDAEAR